MTLVPAESLAPAAPFPRSGGISAWWLILPLAPMLLLGAVVAVVVLRPRWIPERVARYLPARLRGTPAAEQV